MPFCTPFMSRSTPGYRFDTASCALPPAPIQARPDRDAADFVASTIDHEPVVLFALEWCEFSWSVRKLFARLGIDARHRVLTVDRDGLDCQERTA